MRRNLLLATALLAALSAIALVPALAGAASPGAMSVSPARVNFGRAPINSHPDPVTVTYTNAGSESVTFSPGVGTSTPFSYGYSTCWDNGGVLAVGDSCTVAYSFVPTVKGHFKQTVTLRFNGASGPVYADVVLSGNAY